MAAHSNRSPSPLSSTPSSPNPRNSEIYSTTRRSFNGNNLFAKPSALTNPRRPDPITPANSPSDFARRRSVGKESTGSCLKDCEEKENIEKDHIPKTSKLHSPAKGSKNFMAPTISAASKFTPSPRKKALVERNDPVRTSISLSDGKAMFFSNVSEDLEPKPEMSYHQNQKNPSSLDLKFADSEKKEAVQEGHPVSKPSSKKVTFLDVPQDSQNANESFSSDSLKMESSLKNNNNISCSPISPPIAPLDADPSMPPYDPKTNYLSPRPQFLYYKPNPRIEVLLNKEKGMDADEFKPLEDDSFMTEIMSDNFSSDTEGTEDSEKEKLEAIASSDMLIGFEDDLHLYEDSEKEKLEPIASDDMVLGLEFLEDDLHEDHVSVDSEKEKLEAIASEENMFMGLESSDDDLYVSEDCEKEKLEVIASADMVVGLDDDLLYVQKNEKKLWGFSRLMCVSMVMMLLMACASVSVTQSPLLEEFGLIKDLSFSDLGNLYHQSRVAANAKVNFHRLVRVINQFSVDCVSFIFKVADELGKGETKLGPLKYMNLSDLQKDSWHDGRYFLKNNEVSEDLVENVEDDDELDEDLDTTVMENFEEEEETYAEFDDDSDENFENDNTQEDEVSEIEEKMPTDDSSSDLDFEYSEDNPQSQKEIVTGILHADQLAAIISQDQESELEVVPSEIVETEKSKAETTSLVSYTRADITLLDENNPSDASSLSEGVQSLEILETPTSKDQYLAHYYAVGISSLFALLSFAAFIFQYKRNPNPSLANAVQTNNRLLSKQTDYGFSATKQMHQENWQRDDVIGESSSCPSEMSSFQKSASYSNKNEMRGASEVQSIERKTRKYSSKRESLASSSSEFTSYGSFTTFEKIPIKNANGEEKIITPVRRSNRIRNHQITSPISHHHAHALRED